jgi:hypothetical protein
MSRKLIDIGVEGNDGTGDSIRESFRKTNENFQELYSVFGLGGQIAFTDLADTPSSLIGESGKIPVVNPGGSALVFKEIAAGPGITIAQPTSGANIGDIVISSLSSRVQDDPLPSLQFSLDAAGSMIGNLYAPTNDSDFAIGVGQFNAAHYPPEEYPDGGPTADTFAVNKGYVDNKFVNVTGDTMQGYLNVPAGASGIQVPRTSEVITRAGSTANRTMLDKLFLSDHPGELSGRGTPTGSDDLQAATKYYVDASTYASNINLYVSTSGTDDQSNTPLGKEGRSWAYAYRSLNRAAQKAEELMDQAPIETGPYRQLIAFGQGKGFSEVSRIEEGAEGTTRVYFTNNDGGRVDQGLLPRPDIVAGKLVVGRTSRARGIIYLYYGSDAGSPIGEDYIDLQDVEGTFVEGENLEFDQPVKSLNLTIYLESGTYEEDFPIRIPQNVSIVGDEFRRVIIRPADRPSESPWADIWFRRDLNFDGMVITTTEYGYHYLTDASDRASIRKNNRELDVFLCGDATIIRQVSCQGHGGFMMVLDPEAQVLSKSPYFQQGSSFSGSLNKQRFAGGQYVDGFTGNLPFNVVSQPSDTELLVSGSERAPATPCSFVVQGRTFKVDTFTNDGTGFSGTRQLILKNKEFIKAEVIGYIDTVLRPNFVFDKTKCARDLGYIIDALGEDFLFGSNYKSVYAARSYYGKMPYDNLDISNDTSLEFQRNATIEALTFLRTKIDEVLVTNTLARSRANANLTEIIDVVTNGLSAAATYVIPNTSGTSTDLNNARTILEANFEFLKAEYIAKITAVYPSFVFDEVEYGLELEQNLWASIYDSIYGGNTASVSSGLRYFNPDDDTTLISGQTAQIVGGLNHIIGLLPNVITGVPILVANLAQTDVDQVTGGGAGTSTESSLIVSKLNIIKNIIFGGVVATPAIVNISVSTVANTLVETQTRLQSFKSLLQSDVLRYLNLRFTYNVDNYKKETGYIVEAIAHDVFYNGNLETVQTGLSYFKSTASAQDIIETQLETIVATVEYINTLMLAIIDNQPVATRYQTAVPQVTDSFNTTGALGTAKVNALFDELIEILDNPLNAVDARSLLVSNKKFIEAEVISFISVTYKTTVTATSASTDQLTCDSTANLRAGMPIEFGVSSSIGALQGTKNLSGDAISTAGVYTNVPLTATSGVGQGAVATISKTGTGTTYTNTNTIITITTNGTGFKVNDSIKIFGSLLGGADGVNDLLFRAAPSTVVLLGGLSSGVKYYVKEVLNPTSFTISRLPNGDVVPLIDGSGSVPGQLSYDFAKCARDTGFIVANVSADLLYGGTYNAVRSAQSYQTARAGLVVGEQLTETLAALEIAKATAINVLNQTTPATSYQTLNGIATPVTQVLDNTLDGSASVTRLTALMDIVTSVIQNPNFNITTIIPSGKSIVYPVYRLVVSDPRSAVAAGITNPLNIGVTTFGNKIEDPDNGAFYVTLNHATQSVALYEKTRYTISGNSNPGYNKTVECISTTVSSMTFKFVDGDPGVFGTGTTTTITYIDDIDLLSPGNTSMCSNDYTQVNDLGYGLVATNTGLVEAVSVFSYYCYTAYYANNGGQIRSLNGSNANGEYGLVSSGSDPLEIPDRSRLRNNMMQVGRVYKTGIYSLDNIKDDLEIYVYNLDYPPYNVSELEVNHGAGIIAEFGAATLVGGTGYTNGTYLNVPLTGGTGNGAKANIVVAGNQVTVVSLTGGGIQYTVGDLLSAGAEIGPGTNFSITVGSITGNGFGRYEVATVTDVSASVPLTITSAGSVSGIGPYSVTFNFVDPDYVPRVGTFYTVAGNSNTNYNKRVLATASTSTSVTVEYSSDPGTYGTGTTTVWGQGNIVRINLSTGGNNDTSTTGLAVGLSHDQPLTIRCNQNFEFYEIDDTNPVRPSTALTFVDDPNGAGEEAGVYRVLAYANKDPLNNNLASDASVLSFDTTYDYIKLVADPNNVTEVDPSNPGKTLGATIGDVAIAIDRITENSVIDRLNSADMLFAWDGKMHAVTSYIDQGVSAGYGILRFTDVTEKSLVGTIATGLNSSVYAPTNLDLLDSPTIRIGLAADEFADIVVRISTCRVTGHDFLDIGTGGYNSTNYPSKIYGPPRTATQSREVEERTRGRVFYVTTDQNGIFRVGRFFTVDQGTGRVTFSASIALSNLDGIGFKRGVAISEFSNDEKFTDAATDAVPTENAIEGYVDLRLGLFRSTDEAVDEADVIGPGFLDRAGILSPIANLNIGGFKLQAVGAPAADTDAVNKAYVDNQQLADTKVNVSGKANLDFLMYSGAEWIDVNNSTATITNTSTTIGGGSDLTITRDGNVITYKLRGGLGANNPITNFHINDSAAIAQSKLAMTAATTRVNATSITQADRGLASFKNTEFTATSGWIELQTSTSATTGVTLGKLQHITTGYLLGNRIGSNASPAAITFGQAVIDGDGVQHQSFIGGTSTAGLMFANTANPIATRYDVKPVTTNGAATSIVQTDASGKINVKGLIIDSFSTIEVVGTTLSIKTPGGVTTFESVGSTPGATTVNIRGNTTLTGTLSVSSNLSTSGTGSITSATSVSATTTVGGTEGNFSTHVKTPLIKAGADNAALGSIEGNWSLTSGSKLIATYADLAEYYEGDQDYEVGTVLIFGGEREVTTTQLHMDRRVAGVVSASAAYIMNDACPGIKVCVALQGRVPVKVVGMVKKGDILVAAAKPGHAIVNNDPSAGTIIGKALAAKTDAAPGVVEVAVGRC